MTLALEKNTAITGIGVSQVGRRLERTGLQLTLDAALEAIADDRSTSTAETAEKDCGPQTAPTGETMSRDDSGPKEGGHQTT